MAYLRKEKQTVEIDYPLSEVWQVIPEVLASLDWTVEQTNDPSYQTKVKTNSGFMSYRSKLAILGVKVDDKTCRIVVEGETPVTTITALTDFGRTSDRINLFFETLAKRLHTSKNLNNTGLSDK